MSNGDRIVHTGWGGGCGAVVRVAKSSALVRLDGRDKDERILLHFLRPETQADIAKRAREQALREWRDRQPNVKHVHLQTPCYSNADPTGIAVYRIEMPEDNRNSRGVIVEHKTRRTYATQWTAMDRTHNRGDGSVGRLPSLDQQEKK